MSFAAPFAAPSRAELATLARKYDTIADLRQRRDAGGGVAPRAELFALAREFPGALRELDTLPLDEIERRRAALGRAIEEGETTPGGSAIAPWMGWIIAYHAAMRAALHVKARLARSRERPRVPLDDELVRQIAEDASRHAGLAIDDDFVRAVASPPARRVNAAVFERLGSAFGVPAEAMWQTLFPTRRPRRF